MALNILLLNHHSCYLQCLNAQTTVMVNSTNYDGNNVCKSTFATKQFYGSEIRHLVSGNKDVITKLDTCWGYMEGNFCHNTICSQSFLTYYHHQENRIEPSVWPLAILKFGATLNQKKISLLVKPILFNHVQYKNV